MATVDYMLVCDYVREERGLVHMIAAGVDRIHAPQVPAAQNIGLALRLLFEETEVGEPQRVEISLRKEDQESRLAGVTAEFVPAYPPEGPVELPLGVTLATNVGLPFPDYGAYVLELALNGNPQKTRRISVVPGLPAERTEQQPGRTD